MPKKDEVKMNQIPFLVIIATVLAIVAGYIVGGQSTTNIDELYGYVFGYVLVKLLFSLLVAWIVSKIRKNPLSKTLWGWVYLILIFMSFAVFVSKMAS